MQIQRLPWAFIIALFTLLTAPTLAWAQNAEIPSHKVPYPWVSALHDGQLGREGQARVAERFIVRNPGAPWVRLHFGEAQLAAGSFITITSKDGAMQYLDAVSFHQWQNTSAYFNGDAVEIQLHVAPGDKGIFLQLDEVEVGDPPTESQCGPTDDRVPSNDPAAGRLLSIGCTGWIISNGLHVTAGHCSGSSLNTLEFNVPPSSPSGTIQHPPPEHQYSVNPASKIYTSGGIGDDWGVFQVFPNSNTGLMPIVAQGSSFTVVQNLGPPNIRITGYGVDSGDRNQTQQTHVGPNAGSSGTTMRYQTDTEGGNSGSPVIDDANGTAVGVHTHGGCSTSGGGNNSGTSTFNTAFWSALNPSPSITVNAPNGGENWEIGTNRNITWSSSNITGNVMIELSRNGGTSYDEVVVADTPNDGVHSWNVAGPVTAQARIKITSLNNPAVFDQSNANFTISNPPPPGIAVIQPNGGEDWPVGTTPTITWSSVSVSGNVKIELSRNGGSSYEVLLADTPNDGAQTWTVTGPGTSQALIRISSLSNPSINDQSNAVFKISGAPPTSPCPAKTATEGAPDASRTLDLLYQFRDTVLAENIRGQQYTRLYYQFSNEVVTILLNHPELLFQVQAALSRFEPVIQTMVDGGVVVVPEADLQYLEQLADAFAAYGSPGLSRTLELFKGDLRNPRSRSAFNIQVRP